MNRIVQTICVVAALWFAHASAQTIIGPEKPSPASLATQDTANPSLLLVAASKRVELSQDQIRDEMKALFKWGEGARPYYYYLLSLPKPLKILDSHVTSFNAMIGKDFLFDPYDNASIEANYRGPAITLIVPPELKDLSEKHGICVKLDGFGDPLPVPAAEYFCAHFHNGFVTRLVLGEYVRAWNKAGTHIEIESLNFASDAKKQPIPAAFTQLSSYQTPKPPGAPVESFDAGLEKLMEENDLASAGILWGWKAASELDAIRDKPGDQECFKAAWRLVRSRFSPRQMGQISAFTLHYLLGFARAASFRTSTPADANPQRDVSQILGRLAGESDVVAAKSLLTSFHDVFLTEFYAITVNNRLKPEDKEKLVAGYFDFIRGWESGSIQAGDDMFRRAFDLGYNYGFRDGFKDGYSRGYAAGCRDGYATGYKEAWVEANKEISQLRSELDQARDGAGILKFIDDVFSTGSKAVPVISWIIDLL
ncbi:MAG: hypothetical protein ABSG68_25365 [Thermoguttaceae bacterium]|jgi:hypothetical protein